MAAVDELEEFTGTTIADEYFDTAQELLDGKVRVTPTDV